MMGDTFEGINELRELLTSNDYHDIITMFAEQAEEITRLKAECYESRINAQNNRNYAAESKKENARLESDLSGTQLALADYSTENIQLRKDIARLKEILDKIQSTIQVAHAKGDMIPKDVIYFIEQDIEALKERK